MNLHRSAALLRMTIRVRPQGPGAGGACGEVPDIDGNDIPEIKREKTHAAPELPRHPQVARHETPAIATQLKA
ncbi:unnamed protein product [Ectocarpus sp. 12 AP-2014]